MWKEGFAGSTSGKEPTFQYRTHKKWGVWYLGKEDPLEEGMATHTNIFAWRFPWMGSLAGYSPWGHKESDMTEAACMNAHLERY